MTTTRQARNARFQKGSAVYTCRCCQHRTRDTGGDGASVELCDLCYELAGEENSINDTDETYATHDQLKVTLSQLDTRNGAGTARRCFEGVCDVVGYTG